MLFRSPETRDNTRMDVVISYGGREYIVELKIWRGQQYRQKGLEQLEEYLDSRNSKKGYLISFNFNKDKTYVQNTVILRNSQKEVYEKVWPQENRVVEHPWYSVDI